MQCAWLAQQWKHGFWMPLLALDWPCCLILTSSLLCIESSPRALCLVLFFIPMKILELKDNSNIIWITKHLKNNFLNMWTERWFLWCRFGYMSNTKIKFVLVTTDQESRDADVRNVSLKHHCSFHILCFSSISDILQWSEPSTSVPSSVH